MTAVAKEFSSQPLPVTPRTEPGVFLSSPTLALRSIGLREARYLSQSMPIIVLMALPGTRNAADFAQTVWNEALAGDSDRLQLHEAFEVTATPSSAKLAACAFTFGEVAINFSSMEARRQGQSVFLRPMEFKTLKYFVQNPHRVISRDELLNAVWGYENYPCTRTVDNHILQLRHKLEEDPSRPVHLQTVHGVGYKFLP